MKDLPFSGAFLALSLYFLSCNTINAATLSLDLDIHTPGIQTNRTLNPGEVYAFEVVYTGDGFSQFDTFAFDVVHDSSAIGLHSPVAGLGVDSAPMMALDIYGANGVNSGDLLTQGGMPTPLGYVGGLGGVGVASVGGMPFSLLGEDESVGLFSASLTAFGGSGTLVLTGFPFGVGAELSLAGARVPVTLQGATVTVVPLPPVLWLFASGVLALLGVGYRKGAAKTALNKTAPSLSLLFALAMISPLGLAVPQDSDADLDGDLMVTALDISILASCFGQDPASNSDCAKADVDEDGDIDGDDFSFVSVRLGQAYPETLFDYYGFPPSLAVGERPNSIALGDVNGDGVLDAVVANEWSDDISVLLGKGDGGFQAQQRFAAGDGPESIALGDVNGDGVLDVVVANARSDDISVLLGSGDGRFQAQQRLAVGNHPNSVALGDLNQDNILDVVVANGGEGISVLLGNGDGSFQAEQRLVPDGHHRSIALGDVNGDGVLDALVANLYNEDISVLLGNGDGSFQAEQRFDVYDLPYSIVVGDVNYDGTLDLVGISRSTIFVLLNNRN